MWSTHGVLAGPKTLIGHMHERDVDSELNIYACIHENMLSEV